MLLSFFSLFLIIFKKNINYFLKIAFSLYYIQKKINIISTNFDFFNKICKKQKKNTHTLINKKKLFKLIKNLCFNIIGTFIF
jgi:hypothetical protein